MTIMATTPVVTPFQSTLSVRRATSRHAGGLPGHIISIHALRKESDAYGDTWQEIAVDFNPRSP